jgi:hypothetical protein
MRTIHRASLPDIINYNGKQWVVDIENSARHNMTQLTKLKPYIKVLVISSRLKHKRDLHGNPYRPTEWLFKIKNS